MSKSPASGSEQRPFWAARDRRVLARLIMGSLAAGVLPRRFDHWFLRALARWTERRAGSSGAVRNIEGNASRVLGPYDPDLDIRAMAVEARVVELELGWIRARAFRRDPATLETAVDGLEWLRPDDDGGALPGRILWGMSFCETLVVKIALHRAGVGLVHLSEAGHGAAHPPTRLGLRLVSPLYVRAEKRFLRERVEIPADGSLGYVRTLIRRLEEGNVVYVAGERPAPRQNVVVPCLGQPTPFARGAPGLAFRTGARLLPVTVVRDAAFRYRVVIEEPIRVDQSLGREAFIRTAIEEFADRVTRTVVERPAERDWYQHDGPDA